MLCRMRGLMFGLAACLLLSGCLTTNEVISTGAAAGTALVTSAAGAGAVVVTATSAAAGLAAGVVTPEPETVDETISGLPPEEKAEVLKHQAIWETVEKLGIWAAGIFVLLWFIPSPFDMVKNLLMRRKVARMERVIIDNPGIKHKDIM